MEVLEKVVADRHNVAIEAASDLVLERFRGSLPTLGHRVRCAEPVHEQRGPSSWRLNGWDSDATTARRGRTAPDVFTKWSATDAGAPLFVVVPNLVHSSPELLQDRSVPDMQDLP